MKPTSLTGMVRSFSRPRHIQSPPLAKCSASLVLAALASLSAHAASDSWTGTADASWATSGNWLGNPATVPGTGDTATFNAASPNTTINLGTGVTISNIVFDTASVAAYTIGAGAVGSQSLALDNGGSLSLSATAANNQLVNAALVLSSATNAVTTIANNSAGLLTIAGPISATPTNGNSVLTVSGSGSVALSGGLTENGNGNLALLKTGSGRLTITTNTVWSGSGAIGRVPTTNGYPLVAREGTLLLSGGSNFVNGEFVIGGVVADGGAGQNARVVVDGGTLNANNWFSIGRGNGVGGVSSDLVVTNGGALMAANLSAGFDGGNTANRPKGSVSIHNNSSVNITGNGTVNFAESTGSDFVLNLNDAAQFVATGTGAKRFGHFGSGVVNLNGSSSMILGNATAYIGYRTGTGVVNMASSGTFNNSGELRVGAADANGTLFNARGTLNISSGTVNLGALVVGRGNNVASEASGFVNVNGGVLTVTNDVVLGFAGTNNIGQLNINGGTFNMAPAATKWLMVGWWDYTRGELNINSGAMNLFNNTSIKYTRGNSALVNTNVVNQNGGTLTFYSDLGTNTASTGDLDMQYSGAAQTIAVYNLNGGTLTVPRIRSSQTSGTRIFNFNGGTLRAGLSNPTFVSLGAGSARLNVRNGGAIIDTDGKDVTIVDVLNHSDIAEDNATDGGLTKLGAGTLTLGGGANYNGPTKVLGGVYAVSASIVGTDAGLTVSNATLTLTLNNGSSSYNTAGITLRGNSVLNLNFGSFAGTPSVAINGSGAISASGTTVINVSGIGFGIGSYPLIKYSGAALPNLANFSLGTLPAGLTASLHNNTENLSIDLVVSAAGQVLSWHGANADNTVVLSDWDVNTTVNWYDPALNLVKYLQYAANTIGDNVTFGDHGFNNDGTNQVTLNTTVVPASVFFSSSSHYRVSGTGAIGGGTSVVLTNNSGSVTLATANSYTGGTVVGGGSLVIANDSALGAVSGALSLSGGTLNLNGNINSSRGVALTAESSVGVGSGFTAQWNGVVSGSGILNKIDEGKLTLAANNTYSGSTVIKAGIFAVSAGVVGTTNTDVQISPEFSDTGVLEVSGGVVNASRVIIGGNSLNTGSPGSGTLNQTGGTINSRQWFTVGSGVNNGSSGSGIYNFSGGTLNIHSQTMEVGNFTTTDGTVNMSGTAELNVWNNQSIALGANPNANSGTFNQNGGTVTFYSDAGVTTGGNGALQIGRNATLSGTFTYNLNAGTLNVPQIQGTVNAAARVFNFNGGTLRASKPNATFLFGLTEANVQAGGAIIDSSSNSITINQGLLNAGGGLTKLGSGTLRLLGTNTYTGATLVNAGLLYISPNHIGGGSVAVANGTTFGVSANATESALIGSLNLGTGGATTLDFSYSVTGNPTGAALTAGAVTINGTATVRISGAFAVGAFPILKYTSLSGSFAGVSAPRGVTATLSNDAVNKTYYVVISSVGGGIVWTGSTGLIPNLWDINTTTNWLTGNELTTYQEAVIPGDSVTFNDTGSGTVLVSNTVSPLIVTVSNSATPYTIQGSGQITSFGGLRKVGAGTVSVNVPAAYAGSSIVSNGTYNLGANHMMVNLSGNGTLGTSAGTPTLTVSNDVPTTFSGPISGALILTKVGNATLNLGATNTYSGATLVGRGQLTLSGSIDSSAAVSQVGNAGGSTAILEIAGGTFAASFNPAAIWNSSLDIGVAANAVGILRMNTPGSVLTAGKQISVGFSGFGVYSQSAGATTLGGFLAVGGNTNGGVFNQSGGSFTLTGAPATFGYVGTAGRAVATLSGTAVFNANGPAANDGVWIGEVGTAELNLLDNAAINIANSGVVLGNANGTLSSGTLNVRGGTITARSISKGTGTGIVNLNGGTLKAGGSTNEFMAGLTTANVFSGGVRVDSAGFDIAIGQDLLAPAGEGVTSISIDTPGSGYVDAPIVNISGGSGVGATALAQINPALGTVTNILITSPGTGYVNGDFLTVTFAGGGTTNHATAGATATFAPNVSGGLVKVGLGTLALNGTSTYTGSTIVSNGTLAGVGTIAGSLIVRSGAALAPGNAGFGTFTVQSSPTLQGAVKMDISRDGGTFTSDLLEAGSASLVYGGTLVLTNIGTEPLQVGDSFKLFNGASYSGSFSIVSQTPGQSVTWNTANLTVDGTLSVASVGSPIAENPTNITFSVTGSSLNLSWPNSHLGWVLQAQTNALNVGLRTNWSDIVGSESVTTMSIPVNKTNPAVFYRLRKP